MTDKRIRCPHCEDHDLEVETAGGVSLGFLEHEPECDVEGPYFSGDSTHVVFCVDCGEVTAHEVIDFLYPDWRELHTYK